VVKKDQSGYVRLLVLVPCFTFWPKLLNLALAFGYFLGCLKINGTGFEVDLGKLFAWDGNNLFCPNVAKLGLQSSQMSTLIQFDVYICVQFTCLRCITYASVTLHTML